MEEIVQSDGRHPACGGEAEHTSGLTSRLVLEYVEMRKGPPGVDDLLEGSGLKDREELLYDEDCWFGFDTKLRLLEAAARVLGEPDVARRVGSAVLDLSAGAGLKLALRAFGSPRLVYENLVAAAGKFTSTHCWETVELSDTCARLRYRDIAGVGYHLADCQFNVGLLSCVPGLFGLPSARVRHRHLPKGADACEYEARWRRRSPDLGVAAAWAVASAAAMGGAARFAPTHLPFAGAVSGVGAGLLVSEVLSARRRAWRTLESTAREEHTVAERLALSLQDLVSDLRLEEVLDKVVQHARRSVGGKEFCLLVLGEQRMSRSTAGVSAGAIAQLEQWGSKSPEIFEKPVAVPEVAQVTELAGLTSGERVPLASLLTAPLVFREDRLGALVALAHAPHGFLPRDSVLLESYAAQAAIALAQGRMVEQLATLARQDPLTGLLNHREFHEATERELERCRRYSSIMSVVVLDLDHLKRVNDARGHAEGDRVLRAAATEILNASRASDIACRVGGDEFALVLPESSGADGKLVGQRAATAIEELDLGVGISFGVAEWPGDGPDKGALLASADRELYDAKRARAGRHG